MKLLLAISLITVQLLSGGGAPLYLCFCCDGSIYLDEGPETSECRALACRVEVPESACCLHDQCDDDTHGSFSNELSLSGGDCGCCIHVPVPGSRTPSLITDRTRADAAKFQLCANLLSCARMVCTRASEAELRLRFKTRKPSPSLALRELGSVNLRC